MSVAVVEVLAQVFLNDLRTEGGAMGFGDNDPSDAWKGDALPAEDWAGTVPIGRPVEYGGGSSSASTVLLAYRTVLEGLKVRVLIGAEEEAVRWRST